MSEQPGQSEPLTHWDRITRGAPLDFRNSDHIQSVLEEGNEEQVEALKQATGMDNNDVAIRRHFARLRRQAILVAREDYVARREQGVVPTEEEMSLAILLEELEPHVRQAVRTIAAKGYTTRYSGFKWQLDQEIGLAEALPEGWKAPENVAEAFAAKEATPIAEGSRIGFSCVRPLELAELEGLWNVLAEAVPAYEGEKAEERTVSPGLRRATS